ncbi:FtsW/RodA/SpoVE family cell cycle protein [Pseudoduganella sp. FT93W]|uniref:Probable peptidoglycan glycosyltransferase FtsW n=1 Tax=Duganella fentianensis TaxID=2692177 RepID=A0A845HVB7_9BURK|nr:FtsW/RodA/SpoVE family cell cycle protein [Duganella fentianensis]
MFAALMLPAALLALQLLATLRAPAAWQPASIAVRLAAGDSIELGARELAAAQADRRHLRLRHDAQQGWMVQNLSSTHRLLLQSGDTEQHSGSSVLASGQRFQLGTTLFRVDSENGGNLAFSTAEHHWRYDGAVLYPDGKRQPACPQSHGLARLAGYWNAYLPRWLALARPLTLGGNLYCDNRLGLAQASPGSALITREHGRFLLHAGNPDGAPLPVLLLPRHTDGQMQVQEQVQDIRRQELPVPDAGTIIIGHTRFAIALHDDTLTLRPTQHVQLYTAPEISLPQAVQWQWQQRELGLAKAAAPVRTLAIALAICLAGVICLYGLHALSAAPHAQGSGPIGTPKDLQHRTTLKNRLTSALTAALTVTTALLLLGCALAAMLMQRSVQAPPASLSLLLASSALLLWLSHPARRTMLGICACSLLALGLLSQLELGLGASESAWLRFYQKSSALLALGASATALCQLWLQRRKMQGHYLPQRQLEWLLAGFAAVALAGLLLQVVFGDETGVFDLQPVELAKLALTALTAHCLALRFSWHEAGTSLSARSGRWLHLIAPALLFLMLLGLALVQVDDFSPLILLLVWCSAMALAYALAARRRGLLAGVIALGLLAVAAITALRLLGSDELIRWGFYADRFLVWLHPALHPHTGQQLLAGAQAIADGGWWGSDQRLGLLTLGQHASDVLRVPAIQDDFAASFFLNRHGLLAGLLLWCLQASLLYALVRTAWQNYQLALSARHFRQAWLGRFRYFALCGAAALVLGHFLLSWGTNLAIFPIMGQPMSFLSAGGSHLLFFLCPLLAFSAFSAPSMQGE